MVTYQDNNKSRLESPTETKTDSKTSESLLTGFQDDTSGIRIRCIRMGFFCHILPPR